MVLYAKRHWCEFLVFKLTRLYVGGDAIPNCLDVSYVILLRGSHDKNTNSDSILSDCALKKNHLSIVIPLIESLRVTSEAKSVFFRICD